MAKYAKIIGLSLYTALSLVAHSSPSIVLDMKGKTLGYRYEKIDADEDKHSSICLIKNENEILQIKSSYKEKNDRYDVTVFFINSKPVMVNIEKWKDIKDVDSKDVDSKEVAQTLRSARNVMLDVLKEEKSEVSIFILKLISTIELKYK